MVCAVSSCLVNVSLLKSEAIVGQVGVFVNELYCVLG
jgi:hypothetical protein